MCVPHTTSDRNSKCGIAETKVVASTVSTAAAQTSDLEHRQTHGDVVAGSILLNYSHSTCILEMFVLIGWLRRRRPKVPVQLDACTDCINRGRGHSRYFSVFLTAAKNE